MQKTVQKRSSVSALTGSEEAWTASMKVPEQVPISQHWHHNDCLRSIETLLEENDLSVRIHLCMMP